MDVGGVGVCAAGVTLGMLPMLKAYSGGGGRGLLPLFATRWGHVVGIFALLGGNVRLRRTFT